MITGLGKVKLMKVVFQCTFQRFETNQVKVRDLHLVQQPGIRRGLHRCQLWKTYPDRGDSL